MPQGRIEDFDPQIFSQLIDDAGMTRGYVAVMMGVTEAVVGRWVTGVGSPSAPRAKRLAELLDVDVLDLAGKTLETADITELRQRCGLEIKDVARELGASPSAISRLERTISTPAVPLMGQLAELYGVSLDTIKRSWVNRRIGIYGAESLERLPEHAQEWLGLPYAD